MMIHPEGQAVFVEVPKTGSTAATKHLSKHKWFQNGSKAAVLPGTTYGRHSYPNEITRRFLEEHLCTSYGVVRNPWDRMASLWRASAPGNTPFFEYMTTGKFKHGDMDILMQPQRQWLEHVDVVMTYERLAEDWDKQPDLPPGPLPVVNRSKNRAMPAWTKEEIDLVAERFAIDIETYGYEGPTNGW